MIPFLGETSELRVLRWVAGEQAFHDSPDSRYLGALRDLALARDELGRIVLTGAGRARLEALEDIERSSRERSTS